MHPVMVTIPGALFKMFAPLLLLWGCYSLIMAAQRRSPSTSDRVRALPADSPANAALSIAIGIGLFLFTAPVVVPAAMPPMRLLLALRVFAHAVIDRSVWTGTWTSIPVYSYGVMLGSSLVLGWFVTLRYGLAQGFARDRMVDAYLTTAIAAIIGSRVLYVITRLDEFRDPETHRIVVPLMFALRTGGLVAYGGFLGGLLGAWGYLRANKLPFWKWADAAVPSLASGLAVTRVGCYLYGCDFGRPLSSSAPGWLRRLGTFPHWEDNHGSPAWIQHHVDGVRVDATSCIEHLHGDFHEGLCFLDAQSRASAPVHPTQLYESLLGVALFVVIVALWRRRRFEGQVFLAFGALYGFARAALEVLRDDHDRGSLAGFSTSQILGVATGLACVGAYLWRRKHAPRAEPMDLFARSGTRVPTTAP